MTYVLDTHAFAWFLEDSPRLSEAAGAAIEDGSKPIVVPTIVLAEIAFLAVKHRVKVDMAAALAHAEAAPNCTVYPLNDEVLRRLPTTLDIHDAIIVATALAVRDIQDPDTVLVTRDERITASGLIPVLW